MLLKILLSCDVNRFRSKNNKEFQIALSYKAKPGMMVYYKMKKHDEHQ